MGWSNCTASGARVAKKIWKQVLWFVFGFRVKDVCISWPVASCVIFICCSVFEFLLIFVSFRIRLPRVHSQNPRFYSFSVREPFGFFALSGIKTTESRSYIHGLIDVENDKSISIRPNLACRLCWYSNPSKCPSQFHKPSNKSRM